MDPSKPTQEDDHSAVLPGKPDAGQSQQQGGSKQSQSEPADHSAVLPAQPEQPQPTSPEQAAQLKKAEREG
jgi:hypothetical protein